jgi:adenylate cyclase
VASAPLPLSPAVQLAWQIAADEAMHARHSELEPDHLLLGICGIPKALTDGVPERLNFSAETLQQARAEWQVIANSLAAAAIDPAQLRRELRKRLGGLRSSAADKVATIPRSSGSRQVFRLAAAYAGNASVPAIELAHLLAAVLDHDRPLCALLRGFGQNVDGLRSALDVVKVEAADIATPLPPGAGSPAAEIVQSLDATLPLFRAAQTDTADRKRLAMFYDLPRMFDPERPVQGQFQQVLERVLEAVPGARRGALLLLDPQRNDLLLKAHVPVGAPAISTTSAHWSMRERRAFIWRRGEDLTASQKRFELASGIYAPLIAEGAALGVLFVENPERDDAFTGDDMNVLVGVANHLAMALTNESLQTDLRRNTLIMQRLLTNFSPRIRDRLLDRARKGKLRLGGEKSEVSVLMADIRGFTRTTEKMDSADVVEMLNQYLSLATSVIFQHDGTVDKFIGDAVLAVFGSPDPDADHHEKAVRAALCLQQEVSRFNSSSEATRIVACQFGVGVHCGEVLHGFIGSDERMEYTVIGAPVNRVSRFSQAAPAGKVLISPELYQHVWRTFQAEKQMVPSKHEGEILAFCLSAEAQ